MSARSRRAMRRPSLLVGAVWLAVAWGDAARAAEPGETTLRGELVGSQSVWTRARERTGDESRALVEAERLLSSDPPNAPPGLRTSLRKLRSEEGVKRLREAGVESSRSPEVRHLYATLLQDAGKVDEAQRQHELVAHGAPVSVATQSHEALGVLYARSGDRARELAAYDRALAGLPVGTARSIVLANRAESAMSMGALGDAIAGYREALAQLDHLQTFLVGVTTHWGLAVALDRYGDLDAAIASVSAARAYDPLDLSLRLDSWFFSPPWDEAWFWALGALAHARADSGDARVEKLEAARARYVEYASRAPVGDRYAPLAVLRARALGAEVAATQRAAPTKKPR
jgi:tetratricopeptide (TPR) repeat protein